MRENGYITEQEYTAAAASPLAGATHSGSPITRRPGIASMPLRIRAAVSRMRFVASRYPCSPRDAIAAQQAALNAPGRLPARVGEKYRPPGQSVEVKYW